MHFTGSAEVGGHLAAIAAGDLRLASLELGGDNAFVVLDDADVEQAAARGAWTAFEYQGQTCITASRHIVQRAVTVEGLAFRQTPQGLTLNILNRELPDPNGPSNVTFYHYLLQVPGTPVIDGSPRVGAFVTADPGTWTPAATLRYQWLVNGTPVAGATGTRFHLLGKYLADTVTVQVTGTWTDGTSRAVESAPVQVVTGSGLAT